MKNKQKEILPENETEKRQKRQSTPQKLKLLFTIVNRSKGEFYADTILQFDANMQLGMAAQGTAKSEMLELLGLSDNAKTVIISVLREDKVDLALEMLEKKFKTVKNGKGIAFTVPMDSVIGVTLYQFFSFTGK